MKGGQGADGPLKVQLQAACERQLAANQASLLSFVTTIAAICENSFSRLQGVHRGNVKGFHK